MKILHSGENDLKIDDEKLQYIIEWQETKGSDLTVKVFSKEKGKYIFNKVFDTIIEDFIDFPDAGDMAIR